MCIVNGYEVYCHKMPRGFISVNRRMFWPINVGKYLADNTH